MPFYMEVLANFKQELERANGKVITVAGVVVVRQRPSTASGIIFITIEDETGSANLIVRPEIFDRYRRAARNGVILLVKGRIERQGKVVHVLAQSVADLTQELGALTTTSRDFH